MSIIGLSTNLFSKEKMTCQWQLWAIDLRRTILPLSFYHDILNKDSIQKHVYLSRWMFFKLTVVRLAAWSWQMLTSRFSIQLYRQVSLGVKCLTNSQNLKNSSIMSPVPKVKFNNGKEFPIFGLGTWKVGLLKIWKLFATYWNVYK